MIRPDMRYFEERAEQEIALAQAAVHPNAVKAHYELAGHYLDHVYGNAPLPVGQGDHVCKRQA